MWKHFWIYEPTLASWKNNIKLLFLDNLSFTYWAQSRMSRFFGSRPVGKCPWRTEIHQQQQIIIVKCKQCLLRLVTCPSICLKDEYRSAATDHHRKVETVSPSVLELSINLFKGRISISSNRLSSQSRNIFSFCSRPVPKCPWRTHIDQRQEIIIPK